MQNSDITANEYEDVDQGFLLSPIKSLEKGVNCASPPPAAMAKSLPFPLPGEKHMNPGIHPPLSSAFIFPPPRSRKQQNREIEEGREGGRSN